MKVWELAEKKLYTGAQALSLLASHLPASATTNKVIGHLGTYNTLTQLYLKLPGMLREGEKVPQPTLCLLKDIHCGLVLVFVTCLGCHTSTPVASQASHNYHRRCAVVR